MRSFINWSGCSNQKTGSSSRLGFQPSYFRTNLKYRIWKSNFSCLLAGAPQQKQGCFFFFLKACTRCRKGHCFGFKASEKQNSVFPFCHYSSKTLQVNKSHVFILMPPGDTLEDWIMAKLITRQVSHKLGLICVAQMYFCRNRYFKEF